MKPFNRQGSNEEGWYYHSSESNIAYWQPPFHRVNIYETGSGERMVLIWKKLSERAQTGEEYEWVPIDVSHCKDLEEIKAFALAMWRMS